MVINYKGCSEEFPYRLAEVSFKDDEYELVSRIEKLLRIRGWGFEIVTDGYATCKIDDQYEYREFVKEYKDAKRCIKNCMKYGF